MRRACEYDISINMRSRFRVVRCFVPRCNRRRLKRQVVYDFTFDVWCRCQRALRRHALTANHEWQVIATLDTQMPKLRHPDAYICATRINCGTVETWRNPCDVQKLVAIAREWSAGDYRGIITSRAAYPATSV